MRAQRSEHKIYAAVVRSIVLYHVLRISLTERLRTSKVVKKGKELQIYSILTCCSKKIERGNYSFMQTN